MISKQSIILVVTFVVLAAVVSCDEQDVSSVKYGQFSHDEEGFVKLCLTVSILTQESRRYGTEDVAKELSSDKEELYSLTKKYTDIGITDCVFGCSTESPPKMLKIEDLGGYNSIGALCKDRAKFQRLCEKFGNLVPNEGQVTARKDWVCEVAQKIPSNIQLFCEIEDIHAGEAQAEREFDSIRGLTEEQFEETKSSKNNELNNLLREKVEHDQKIREQALAKINAEVAKLLPQYKKCWLEEQKVQKKARGQVESCKKGIFGKIGLFCQSF